MTHARRALHWPLLIALLIIALLVAAALAGTPGNPVLAGRALLEKNCARCHAIGTEGASPLAIAPPFRTLHERYDVDGLAEALAEGIVTGHPNMPQFTFTPEEIDGILAYLESLERKE